MQIGTADRRADPGARPLPHAARARRGDRLHGGGDHRGHRVQQRLLHPLPRRPDDRRRRRRACSTRSASTTRPRARRDPRVDQAAARAARTPREKKILLLRFFKNMTQSQIAAEIGVSQMHVSRLLTRTLAQLRTSLEARSARPELGLSSATRQGASSARAGAGSRRARPAATTASSRRPPSVVAPPRKLHARPSWISWASTTGPRAQALPPGERPGADQQAAAVHQEEHAVVSPIVSRSAVRRASSSDRRAAQQRRSPRRPPAEAARRASGGGVGGSGWTSRPASDGLVVGATARVTL